MSQISQKTHNVRSGSLAQRHQVTKSSRAALAATAKAVVAAGGYTKAYPLNRLEYYSHTNTLPTAAAIVPTVLLLWPAALIRHSSKWDYGDLREGPGRVFEGTTWYAGFSGEKKCREAAAAADLEQTARIGRVVRVVKRNEAVEEKDWSELGRECGKDREEQRGARGSRRRLVAFPRSFIAFFAAAPRAAVGQRLKVLGELWRIVERRLGM